VLAEHTAASVFRFAVMTCEVESTDVSPPTVDADREVLLPPFIWVRRVGFPYADWAPGDLLSTLLVLAAVTLLQKVALFLNIVVPMAGVTGAEMASFSRVRGSIGWGGVSLLKLSMKLRTLRRCCPLGVESNVKGSSH
jgi:hypothetical protein